MNEVSVLVTGRPFDLICCVLIGSFEISNRGEKPIFLSHSNFGFDHDAAVLIAFSVLEEAALLTITFSNTKQQISR